MSLFDKGVITSFFGLSDNKEENYEYEEPLREERVANDSVIHSRRPETVRERESRSTDSTRESRTPEENTYENDRSNVVNLRNTKAKQTTVKSSKMSNMKTVEKISIIQPRVYSEAKEIAQAVIRNEIVLVNFSLIEESQARRIVDFLTGTVFALDGDIKRVGNEIFLCTPPNMEIDGATATAKSVLGDSFIDF